MGLEYPELIILNLYPNYKQIISNGKFEKLKSTEDEKIFCLSRYADLLASLEFIMSSNL